MTRKQFRTDVAKSIKECTDFSDNGAIQSYVSLIRHELGELTFDGKINTDTIHEYLNGIEECCIHNHATMMQNYHAFEMMHHFALCVGEKYDPMY